MALSYHQDAARNRSCEDLSSTDNRHICIGKSAHLLIYASANYPESWQTAFFFYRGGRGEGAEGR